MRRIATILFAVGTIFVAASPAFATAKTDCHHGNSNKPCRPDPQPTHGKDCTHPSKGNPAGINQDHCTGGVPSTTTTTLPETTTTTLPTVNPPTTTTTVPILTPPGTSTPVSPIPNTPITTDPVTPSTHCVTPDGYPYTTSYDTCPLPIVPTVTTVVPVQPITALPHTGAASDILALVGVFCLGAGGACLLLRRAMRYR